ncbi:MAG: hypothetical protein PWP07_2626 [Epulopiscium sp.]|jgi:uncharacterized protein|uniref:DUF177 domain-containing protein n=1 Tax=Defluviitalea raffinosedens TaxID=1450156 RepID=A0A7C8LRP7_9FIRM|nr:DUF177 domain-containing protein [Defluviitalea raffinosedens]MBZ4668519.1 hypothetical protein [Defluviitaleaceae bacterium]MDK2789381.1 hypothetical protein [Candidatus Epulonipiscium sp.]KAE9637185.1 DUF177 domain-containing protein [Defluviitalea raffinosedens]MBM7686511.1 uncharacterized protein [Defluviitalea raffinosedens]HHW66788.1 DUF177 domain-containing protein [Candidatus Epulonipiscium sp.]
MIVNVSKIIKIPDITMELSFEEKIDFIESSSGKIKLLKPVYFTGTIANDGKVLYLKGNLSTVLELYCDRCTKPVETSLSINIEEKFSSEPIDEEEIHEINSGSEIDLTPIFIDAILLNIPMKIVCDTQCKGLCSQCGQNLNEGTCDCNQNEYDPRFAVLKTLFKDSE